MMKQRGEPVTSLTPLDDLRTLVDEPGPFLSAYLPLGPANEELAEATALRWRELRQRAESQGAPRDLLDRVDPAVEDAHREAEGLCVVAPAGGPVHVEHLEVPAADLATWRPAPVLAPLIATRQRRQPHVVALVDRQGADLTARTPTSERTESVDGDDFPLRKVGPGGWSQRRYQQRAEETWQRNMKEVADELAALADASGARVVAVGGDERAVGLLLDDLPPRVGELVAPIDVTRAPDGSIDHLDDELDRLLDAWVDAHLDDTLATYRQEIGQHDRATEGSTETAEALRRSQVATLLVPAPTPPAPDPEIDAAVVAALDTGADVQVVPRGLDRLAAILRW